MVCGVLLCSSHFLAAFSFFGGTSTLSRVHHAMDVRAIANRGCTTSLTLHGRTESLAFSPGYAVCAARVLSFVPVEGGCIPSVFAKRTCLSDEPEAEKAKRERPPVLADSCYTHMPLRPTIAIPRLLASARIRACPLSEGIYPISTGTSGRVT